MVTTSKKVLVVDDEDVVCQSYERVLTAAGFEVAKAHSGTEALEEVEEHHYDVMLADLRMPGMDGLEVVEELRKTHPKMRVVVITGFPTQDTLQEAARLGVTDYLTKPVAPDMLTHATTQALEAPPWSQSAPYLAHAAVPAPTPVAGSVEVPEAAVSEPLVWPEQPVAQPVSAPAAEVAVAAAPVEEPEPGALRVATQLAFAPVISLAYVMFLPFAGFAIFAGLGAKAVHRRFTSRRA